MAWESKLQRQRLKFWLRLAALLYAISYLSDINALATRPVTAEERKAGLNPAKANLIMGAISGKSLLSSQKPGDRETFFKDGVWNQTISASELIVISGRWWIQSNQLCVEAAETKKLCRNVFIRKRGEIYMRSTNRILWKLGPIQFVILRDQSQSQK